MTKPPSSPRLSLILTLLVAAQFVIVLDFSIVQIALPTMRTELGISLANSQWIVSAYGLTFAGFLLLSGRASDLYGRCRLSATAGPSILVYGLANAANEGFLALQALAPLALAAVVLAGFVVIEHKSSAPLMPLSFLRRGAVFSANALAILTISAVSAMIFLLTIYLQQIQGYSALSAGFAFLPTALVFLSVGGYLSAKRRQEQKRF